MIKYIKLQYKKLKQYIQRHGNRDIARDKGLFSDNK